MVVTPLKAAANAPVAVVRDEAAPVESGGGAPADTDWATNVGGKLAGPKLSTAG